MHREDNYNKIKKIVFGDNFKRFSQWYGKVFYAFLYHEEFCGYITKTKLTRKDLFKTLAIFGGSLILLSQTENAYAHPPSDIIITFESKTKILTAVIMHHVSNPENHFIKKVDIALNAQEIIEHKLSRQDNNVSQTVSYLIPDAKAGDTLSAEAYCSISGKLRKEIKIGP